MASYPLPGLYRIQYNHFQIGTSALRTPYLVYKGFSIEYFIQELVWPRTLNLVHIGFGLRLTPNDPVVTCDTNTCTRNPLKCRLFSWFHRETDRENDREVFGFGFVFFRFCFKNRPKPTDPLVKNRKTDRAIFHFRFTTLPSRQHEVQQIILPQSGNRTICLEISRS